MIENNDAYRMLAIRAPVGTSYHDGVVRLSSTDEPSDLIFDLHPLAFNGFGWYQFRILLNDVMARETIIEVKPNAQVQLGDLRAAVRRALPPVPSS
jgi:hypothetical protein